MPPSPTSPAGGAGPGAAALPPGLQRRLPASRLGRHALTGVVTDQLRREPVRVSGPQMKRALEREEEIAALGMGAVDVSGLPWPVCES
ncbi:hypothetical protein DMH15_05970 [Streptomyces sp. WAC 06725]|uniref:hypothetical protein n=1 Tax=Streptomyces sp. WAC 06725 TaxID=2203209 RepID=UPI001003E157|nr:hypothetical protein [Streptomyces sp. WAC 06725]RSO47622.1 hypothetical protein DMH15_05970 [Streptomyces sp. WAC 06725]